MKDWIDNLPTKEKRYVTKAWEAHHTVTTRFCADVWIEKNPEKTLELRTCFRTFGNLQLCPYQPNSEPCRF